MEQRKKNGRVPGFGAAALSALALLWAAEARPQEAFQALEEVRSLFRAEAGRPLPRAASAVLSGRRLGRVIPWPDGNELWLEEGGRITDWAQLFTGVNAGSPALLPVWQSGQRPVAAPSALLRAAEGQAEERLPEHPLAACRRRLAQGGALQRPAGPLREGWRIAGGSIISDAGFIGVWTAEGESLLISLRGGSGRIPCSQAAQALPAAADAGARGAEDALRALLLALEDGNAALDRVIVYQERLLRRAEADPAAARAELLSASACRRAATLAVICDRLPATFRQDP